MKLLAFFLIAFFFELSVVAESSQKEKVVLKIDTLEYTLGEFTYMYNKNSHLPNVNESPEEFADRFINYKLKVVEAVNQGLDTLPSFLNEYNSFKSELKNSSVLDEELLEQEANEAYSRFLWYLDVSHILIRVPRDASPDDTLSAWNRADDILDRIRAGEDFNELASSVSEDPSASSNNGHLGWFTAFQMVYPFEKVAYNTPPGSVSEIVRTQHGYHMIKVHERVRNPGDISVAHIMKAFSKDEPAYKELQAMNKIDSLYTVLKNGADFFEIAKEYSDDVHTADAGGEMPPFSKSDIVPEFTSAAFALEEDGEISSPVRTDFGWHIIKRLSITDPPSYDEMEDQIKDLLTNSRYNVNAQEQFFISDNEWQKKSENRFRLNEYYDGLLVFEITSSEVWENAGNDSIALYNYFKNNSSKYLLPVALEGTQCLVLCDVDENKTLFEEIDELKKKNLVQILNDMEIADECYECYQGVFSFISEADNPFIVSDLPKDNFLSKHKKGVMLWAGEIKKDYLPNFSEVKVDVINDYSRFVEEKWLNELRDKYEPEFNYSLIEEL
ncbi:peptidylprolyl isomerase [Marinilabiliaceae bacterium ANBcel2]|nr:peptidylprolyl isomerase [Marinilabiliaceae bacterium ANBcel2]